LARYVPNTYRNHRAIRIVLVVALCLVIAVIILTVALFFSLRRHIVYTDDGQVRLDIPLLREELGAAAAVSWVYNTQTTRRQKGGL
jgi:multidrug resistance efflux pump